MSNNLLRIAHKNLSNIRKRLIVYFYNKNLLKKEKEVSSHNPIRVMFYVINTAMWKSDKLLALLSADPDFSPFVVSYLYSTDTLEHKRDTEHEIKRYFLAQNVEFHSGFDFEKNKLIDVDSFHADIVFYAQPYNENIKVLPRKALMAYIPYCLEIDDQRVFHNFLYQNICWKFFLPSEGHKKLEEKYNYNKGRNVVVTGYTLSDYYTDNHPIKEMYWKNSDVKYKRVIWSPHHSILPTDNLDYSNFLDTADAMLEIAKRYSDKIQFVFKPHPLLRDKLNKLTTWGKEKTDWYYSQWESLPNCNYCNGNFVDLFLTSDALIHDCSSFIAEYLYVNKPVMFLSKNGSLLHLNEFGEKCFALHFLGSSVNDIEKFLDNIINGCDELKERRTSFVKNHLIRKSSETVAERIYNQLKQLRRGK